MFLCVSGRLKAISGALEVSLSYLHTTYTMMSDDNEKVKFSQTIKKESEEWLLETYPDADGVQEATRMAISDARLLREGFNVTLTRGRQDNTQNH